MQKYSKEWLQINYHKNMEFFKINNPKLFESLKKNPQKYNLHLDSKGINIINLQNNTFIYPLININDKEVYSMILAHKDIAKNPTYNKKWRVDLSFNANLNNNFTSEEKLKLTAKYCNNMYKDCIKLNLENLDSNKQSNKDLDKIFMDNIIGSYLDSKFLPFTCIYGLLGGIFLQELLEQGYYFHSLIIYEDDIDLFRISLYFLNFDLLFERSGNKNLKNACLIMISQINTDIVSAFVRKKRVSNSLSNISLKQYKSKNINILQDIIDKEKKALMRGWGSFEDEMIGFKNSFKNLRNAYLLGYVTKRINAPICVVGNGASLDLCIDFIKQNLENMIVFSCGTALKVLRNYGIKPDFQIEIERIDYLSDVLKQAGLDDIPLIFGQMADCGAVDLSKQSFAFMRGGSASAYLESKFEDSKEINNFVVEFAAPFVGNAGVALASILGSDVILCGLDCGYIKGFSKHAKNSYYGNESLEIPKDCFKIKGNKDLEVFSNDLFYLSAKNIQSAIKFYKTNHVINIGFGAYFKGALSLNVNEFSLKKIDKIKEVENLKLNFKASHLHINKNEILNIIKNYISNIDNILDSITLESNEINIRQIYNISDNIESYLHDLISVVSNRKGIILLEGSTLHLCYSLLLSCIFARNVNIDFYKKISKEFKDALDSIYNELENELNNI